jgi:hypothetical protein
LGVPNKTSSFLCGGVFAVAWPQQADAGISRNNGSKSVDYQSSSRWRPARAADCDVKNTWRLELLLGSLKNIVNNQILMLNMLALAPLSLRANWYTCGNA